MRSGHTIFRSAASMSVLAAMMAFAPSAALAQAAGESATHASTGGLEEIIVTARKREESLQDTPIAVTALSAEALENHAVRRVDDIAALTPGMTISQNQASPLGATFSLRAQMQHDLIVTLDPPVAVYSDGVFLNMATGSLANSMLDIQRVEVLKGPQGTLYGRNTTGGAVNFYTKTPVDRWEGELTAGAGNYGSYEVSGVLNAPLGGENALRIVGERKGHGGFATNVVNGKDVGDLHSWSVRGTLKLVPAEKFEVLLRGDLARAHSDGGPVNKAMALNPFQTAAFAATSRGSQVSIARELGVYTSGTPTSAQLAAAQAAYNAVRDLPRDQVATNQPSYARMKAGGASATLTYDLGDSQIKSITAYREAHDVKAIDVDASPFNLFRYGPAYTDSKMFTQELQITGDVLDNKLHYALGGYYFWMKASDRSVSWSGLIPQVYPGSTTLLQGSAYDANLKTDSKAVYAQATYDLLENVHLTGGLRYTDESRNMKVSAFTGNGNALGYVTVATLPASQVATNPTAQTGLVCNLPAPLAGTFLGTTPPTPFTSNCKSDASTNYKNWSYTAVLDWNVTPDVMVYAKTSRGFKSGGINERQSTNPLTIRPFLPEILTDYEVGLKAEFFNRRLRVNLDYYHSKYSDIQRTVQIFVDSATATVINNAGKATVDGVELEVTASPVDGLILQGSLGYTDPKYVVYVGATASGTVDDLSSQEFQQVSKWTYTLSAGYAIPTPFGEIRPQVDWVYRSSRNLFASAGALPRDIGVSPSAAMQYSYNRQPGYGLLNATINFKIESVGVDARFWVKNLANKYYFAQQFDQWNVNGNISGFPGDPRTFGLSVTKHF